MIRNCAALALLLAACPAAAQNGRDPLTIEEAAAIAARNSPAALSAEQDIIIARQRMREARFLALPQFTLSGTLSRLDLEYPAVLGPELGDRYIDPSAGDTFYSLRAQALQPLYTGGKNTNTLKLARTAHSQVKVNYEAARADAALAAKKAFYGLLYHRELMDSAGRWLDRARALRSALKLGAYEGLEADMLVSGLADRARQAEEGIEAAHTDLIRALNREPGYKVEARGALETLPVPAEAGGSLVTAMEARPELKSELYKAQMDDIAVNMALVRRYPTIYLGASYDLNAYKFSSLAEASERYGSWLASVSIRFPLSYDIWTQVQQRKAQQRQGELKRVELQDRIRFEIISAHKAALSWQEEARKLGAELDGMKAAYEAAVRTERPSMAALRAVRSLCELEKKRLDAVYLQLLERIRLEWARGRDLGN
jgi:outer membrane protein TolC